MMCMSSFLTNFLVTIFAFMIFELPVNLSETFHQVKGNEISRAPTFHIDPINSSSNKQGSSKVNPIAQSFIPFVVIAPTLFEERDTDHYLPLFAQYRSKDYFLLI